jgi:predicted amidohydrolase YtcJ
VKRDLRMMRIIAIGGALSFAVSCGGAPAPPAADLVVHNAVVYTMNDRAPRAQAIAVRGERIVAIGTDAEVRKTAGAATRLVDARGAAIVPGLQDAHGHVAELGANLQQLDFRGTTSYAEIVERVRQRAATTPAGEWIIGRGWDQNDWADKAFPTHEALSAISPNHPVYLTRVDGHAVLVNRRALDAGGVSRSTKDPDGGRIIRSVAGEPTGVLVDAADALVSSKIPAITPAQLEARLLLADDELHRLGLTMVHDAGADPATVDAYRRLVDAGRLQTRFYVMLAGPPRSLQPYFDNGPLVGYRDNSLTVRAVKLVADGALGSRGAALLEPYADEPATTGLLTTPPEQVYAQTLAASQAGFQTAIHAIGDRGNRIVMDTFERVQREVSQARALRLRVEHAHILDAAEIPRFVRLGIIASMQATHATSDMPWVPARLGVARMREGAYVWQTLLRQGVVLANGSDFPVEEPNPMLGLYAAITRQDPSGDPPGGWMPEQRLTRMQALRSFTAAAAYAAHAERDLGSLEAGKLADFVMLSKDVMSVPPREILTAAPTLIVIGGRVTTPR